MRKMMVVVASATLVIGAGACGGDDDEPTAEEQFCDAAEAVRADIESLADVDMIMSGLGEVQTRFDSIRSGVETMQDAGLEVAAEEIDALETAVDQLETVLSDLTGGDLGVDSAGDVLGAAGEVITSAAALYEVYTTTCS